MLLVNIDYYGLQVTFYCDETDASSSSSSVLSSLSSYCGVGHDNLCGPSSSSNTCNSVVFERLAHWANMFYSNAHDCMIDSLDVQIG
jgi:hypothetical protein